MKDLIYYPGIKISDDNWLKFALLYIDKLSLIVPSELEMNLYEQNKIIKDSTDLLVAITPSEQDKYNAASNFGDQLYRMKNNIGLNPDLNPLNWEDKTNYNYEILLGKMDDNLRKNLIEKKLAVKSDAGIILSEKAASLYMWYLADSISKESDKTTITDVQSPDFNHIQQYLKGISQEQSNTLKWTTHLPLPSSLSEIPISEIIEFRNTESNIELRNEFHKAIQNLEVLKTDTLNEMSIRDINKHLYDVKKQYSSAIKNKFAFVIGMYFLKDFGLEKLPEGLSELMFANNNFELTQTNPLSFKGYRTNNKAIDYITHVNNFNSKYYYQNM